MENNKFLKLHNLLRMFAVLLAIAVFIAMFAAKQAVFLSCQAKKAPHFEKCDAARVQSFACR